jgi:hypothetical protein
MFKDLTEFLLELLGTLVMTVRLIRRLRNGTQGFPEIISPTSTAIV